MVMVEVMMTDWIGLEKADSGHMLQFGDFSSEIKKAILDDLKKLQLLVCFDTCWHGQIEIYAIRGEVFDIQYIRVKHLETILVLYKVTAPGVYNICIIFEIYYFYNILKQPRCCTRWLPLVFMRIGPDLLAMAIGSGEKSSMSKVEAVDDDCDDFKLVIGGDGDNCGALKR